MYGGESTDHRDSECPGESEEAAAEIERVVRAWNEVIRWKAFTACFRCGFPAAVCPRFKRRANGRFKVVRERQCGSIGGFRVGNLGSSLSVKPMVRLWSLAYMYGPDTHVERFLGWMVAARVDRTNKKAVGRWLSKKVE